MDTASLMDALGSIDVMSLKPVLFGIEDLISGIFETITGITFGSADLSASVAEFIQSGLASVGES